jgi:hypothetical protein
MWKNLLTSVNWTWREFISLSQLWSLSFRSLISSWWFLNCLLRQDTSFSSSSSILHIFFVNSSICLSFSTFRSVRTLVFFFSSKSSFFNCAYLLQKWSFSSKNYNNKNNYYSCYPLLRYVVMFTETIKYVVVLYTSISAAPQTYVLLELRMENVMNRYNEPKYEFTGNTFKLI